MNSGISREEGIGFPQSTGIILALLSALLFSFLNLAIRYSGPYLTVWHMMLGRSIFGIVVVACVARFFKLSLLGYRRRTLLGIGVAGMGTLICLAAALILIPLVEAVILYHLHIAFAALLSPLLANEKMSRIEWLFIGLAFLGTVLILLPGSREYRIEWGHFLVLAAAFGNGLTMTLIRSVSNKNNSLTPYFYVSVVGCVVCPVLLLLQDVPLMVGREGIVGLVVLAVLAVSAHVVTNKALAFLPSPKVAVISLSQVIWSGIFGVILFNESLGWHSLIGALLILCSGVCLNLKPGRII